MGRMAQRLAAFGGVRALPGGRVVATDAAALLGDRDRSVIAAIIGHLDAEVASVAITLGPPRYNRKPVVQFLSGDGHTVAFAKIGADPLTSEMVATETEWLLRLAGGTTSPVLTVPQVLWHGQWHERSVVVMSSVDQPDADPAFGDERRLADIAAALVSALGGARDVAVEQAGPLRRLADEADRSGRGDLVELATEIARHVGTERATLAPWHGDFSPWNMVSGPRSTSLIDWEFAGEAMPVGSDLLHNEVMVATHLADTEVTVPLARFVADLASSGVGPLDRAGVAADQQRVHLLLYLLELIRRDVELTRVGRPVTGFEAAALGQVRRLLSTSP